MSFYFSSILHSSKLLSFFFFSFLSFFPLLFLTFFLAFFLAYFLPSFGLSLVHYFLHSFILETYIAPLQDTTTQKRSQPSHGQRRKTWEKCNIWKGGSSARNAAQHGAHSMLMGPQPKRPFFLLSFLAYCLHCFLSSHLPSFVVPFLFNLHTFFHSLLSLLSPFFLMSSFFCSLTYSFLLSLFPGHILVCSWSQCV